MIDVHRRKTTLVVMRVPERKLLAAMRRANPLTQQRRQRLSLSIRALDGWLANATYRELANSLFGAPRISVTSSWKTDEVRDRTIRLVRTGLDLMRGGYLSMLRIPTRRRR